MHSHARPLTVQRQWLTVLLTTWRMRLTTSSSCIACALRSQCVCDCISHSLHIAVFRLSRRCSGAVRVSA